VHEAALYGVAGIAQHAELTGLLLEYGADPVLRQKKRWLWYSWYDIVPMSYMPIELGIWEIAVLALLREAPMHPYQMQRLLRERHKDEVLALKRGSLYHAIDRLLRANFISVKSTEREGRRPERTTYRITAAGREKFFAVLRSIVATPRRESSEFMAAMSFLVHLSATEAVPLLRDRSHKLKQQVGNLSAGLTAASAYVHRINLVESEYLLAMLRAELAWVRSLERDIQNGKLAWKVELIFKDAGVERKSAAKLENRP
jgi:DNA-binding PadR family transcriptional regulator